MKRFFEALFSLIATLFVISLAAPTVAPMLGMGLPAFTASALLLFAAVVVLTPGGSLVPGARCDVQAEVWVRYLMRRFWKDNSWLKPNTFSDDQYVIGGKIVHIPQPGSKPTVVKNPTSFPLTATQRTDTDLSYTLGFYVTTPTHITSAEAQEVSYDKMDSVLGDHAGAINERAAEELLISWLTSLPGAQVKFTTGAGSSANLYSGQTGTRKVLTAADFKDAVRMLGLGNVPKEGRVALLDSNRLDELTTSLDATQTNAFNQYFNAQTGQIGRLYGVDIYERSDVAFAAAALSGGNLAVNAFGAALGATDSAVNLIWQKDALARAMGEVLFYDSKRNPLYAGDIYSASIRFGGRRRRADNLGIVGLIQGT